MKWIELIIVGLTMAYLYSFLEKKLVERFRITKKHDWHTDSIPKHTNGKRMFQILFFILYIAISFWAFNDQFPLIYWVLLFLTLSQISNFVIQWFFEKYTRQYILTACFFAFNILFLLPIVLVLMHFYD